ncbi:MAG TPA: ClpXP protease specificity-enhancing factor SspB [Stellaceae bacterium]|nr:ClpXP protease specificity-enhancing factor SspB [Stellaceae bacterium]
MPENLYAYDEMVENALRGVVREALKQAARHGLRGGHHFYITFRTGAPGVALPAYLLAKYPREMTIVLQHQFWGLEAGEESFAVTLSFQSRMERLSIPFAAVTAFADPSVQFGLQFGSPAASAAEPGLPATLPAAATSAAEESGRASETPPAAAERPAAEIVTLDKFRKR